MANYPIDKQFSRLGISNPVGWNDDKDDYGTSPNSLRKYGPSVVPKKHNKAQPQVPVIPKSFHVPLGGLEPSFSSVLLKNQIDEDSRGRMSNYENIDLYQQQQQHNLHNNGGPIYGNIQHNSKMSAYLPPPPPAASCVDAELPLPPPPPASDLYYHSNVNANVSDDSLLFPDPPVDEEEEEDYDEQVTSSPSPISLISSSYSELRRADCGSTTGSTSNYAPLSQVNRIYETLPHPFFISLDPLDLVI